MYVDLDFSDTPMDQNLVRLEVESVEVKDHHLILIKATPESGFTFNKVGIPLSSIWSWWES